MSVTLSFCSWNIQIGQDLGTVLHAVRERPDFNNLDLLALQEASRHHEREDAEVIAHALGGEHAHHQVIYHYLAGQAQANALIWNRTRFEPTLIETIRLPQHHERQLPRAERMLLRALPLQPRISLMVEGKLADLKVRVYVAHLDVIGFRHKHEQFSAILADLRARPPADLTLLAGDFNTFRVGRQPSWEHLKQDARAAGLTEITGQVQWTAAIRRLRLRQKLDEIFVASVHPLQTRVWSLDIRGSDHIPIFAEIRVG